MKIEKTTPKQPVKNPGHKNTKRDPKPKKKAGKSDFDKELDKATKCLLLFCLLLVGCGKKLPDISGLTTTTVAPTEHISCAYTDNYMDNPINGVSYSGQVNCGDANTMVFPNATEVDKANVLCATALQNAQTNSNPGVKVHVTCEISSVKIIPNNDAIGATSYSVEYGVVNTLSFDTSNEPNSAPPFAYSSSPVMQSLTATITPEDVP